MRNKIVATLFLVMALIGAAGAAGAQPANTYTKPNGVTVIAGDSLAAAGTPAAAVAYAAAQANR